MVTTYDMMQAANQRGSATSSDGYTEAEYEQAKQFVSDAVYAVTQADIDSVMRDGDEATESQAACTAAADIAAAKCSVPRIKDAILHFFG